MTSFLLNEKRTEITKIELKQRVTVLLIPNPHLDTPNYKLERLRLYVNIQNLKTFTNYSGYDPEIGSFNQDPLMQNIDMGRYPTPRMFTFGLDLDF